MLNTSAIAHSKGLSIAFMLYFQPELQKDFFKVIYGFFPPKFTVSQKIGPETKRYCQTYNGWKEKQEKRNKK